MSASLGGCDARRRDTVMDEGEKHTMVCMGESCEEEGSGQTVNLHRASLLCFGHRRKSKARVFWKHFQKLQSLVLCCGKLNINRGRTLFWFISVFLNETSLRSQSMGVRGTTAAGYRSDTASRFSLMIVSMTTWKTTWMLEVSVAVVKWW